MKNTMLRWLVPLALSLLLLGPASAARHPRLSTSSATTGVLTTTADDVHCQFGSGFNGVLFQVAGTYTGQLAVQTTAADGSTGPAGYTWTSISASQITAVGGTTSGIAANATGLYAANVSGASVRIVLASGSGPVTISMMPAITVGTGTLTISNSSFALNSGGTGWAPYYLTSSGLTTTQTVMSGPGKFGGYLALINLNSGPAFIDCFDTTGTVTLGTTIPTFVICIPANATAANGAGANLELTIGIAIANGLKVAAVTATKGGTTVSTGVYGTLLHT